MSSITQRREALHRTIRQKQLHQKFQQTRILLREVDLSDVPNIVRTSLTNLHAALEAENQRVIALSLTELHNVAQQYTIVEPLLGDVQFGIQLQSVRSGVLPVQCSWVEVFLLLIGAQEEIIRVESSAMVTQVLTQMRITGLEGQFQEQIERIIDRLPLQLLLQDSLPVTLNLLDSLQELFQASPRIILYFFGIHPNFPNILIELFQMSHRVNLPVFEEKVVNTAILLLLITSQAFQFRNMPQMKEIQILAKECLFKELSQNEHSELLFTRFRILALSTVALSPEEFEFFLQNTLMNQLANRSTEYLMAIAAILNANLQLPFKDFLRVIASELFSPIDIQEEGQANYRRWLAIILRKCLPAFKELLKSGIEDAIAGWKDPQFSNRVGMLQEMANKQGESFFFLLLEILSTIYEALPVGQRLLNSKLTLLKRYQGWRDHAERTEYNGEQIFGVSN